METLQKRPPEASCDEPPWPDPLPAAQSPAFDTAIAFGTTAAPGRAAPLVLLSKMLHTLPAAAQAINSNKHTPQLILLF